MESPEKHESSILSCRYLREWPPPEQEKVRFPDRNDTIALAIGGVECGEYFLLHTSMLDALKLTTDIQVSWGPHHSDQ